MITGIASKTESNISNIKIITTRLKLDTHPKKHTCFHGMCFGGSNVNSHQFPLLRCVVAMGGWTCPNPECLFNGQMRAGERCPLCGAEAREFDFGALGKLLKEKWSVAKSEREERDVKRVMKRIKCCPRCGSKDVFWASGLPQLWSTWECRRCGYRGPVILEDSEMAAKLRKDYSNKKATR